VTAGDRLRRIDGGWAAVLAIERVVLDAPVGVYNFTVAGVHTYFVLEVGVLVHNCFPTNPNTVIDLGSGGSKEFPLAVLPSLAQRYPKATVIGVDFINKDIAFFLERGAFNKVAPGLIPAVKNLPPNATFVLGDFTKVIANESADLVTSIAPTPSVIGLTIDEASRIVRPGGTVIIVSGDLNIFSLTTEQAAARLGKRLNGPVDIFNKVDHSLFPNSYLDNYRAITLLRGIKR
jgi:SAM-dependent methyltransferase